MRRADHVLQSARLARERRRRARDQHMLQIGQRLIMVDHALMPPAIDDEDLRTRIGQPVLELGARPPRVERHHNRADAGGRKERDRPFGHVAHRQRDAVALPHAERLQVPGQRRHRPEIGVIGDALVLMDGEYPLTMTARKVQQQREVGRRVLPHARRHAVDLNRVHLEPLARRGQQRGRLGQRTGRPGGIERNGGITGQGVSLQILNVGFGFIVVCRNDSVDSRVAQGNRMSGV